MCTYGPKVPLQVPFQYPGCEYQANYKYHLVTHQNSRHMGHKFQCPAGGVFEPIMCSNLIDKVGQNVMKEENTYLQKGPHQIAANGRRGQKKGLKRHLTQPSGTLHIG